MDDFVSYSSRAKLMVLLSSSMAFVLSGLWFVGAFGPIHLVNRAGIPLSPEISQGKGGAIGASAILFFGFCAIGYIKMIFSGRIEIRINSQGILWTRWSNKVIPWDQISQATIGSIKNQEFINLSLRNPSLYLGHGLLRMLAGANRDLTGADISIIFAGMDRSCNDAMKAISWFRQPSENSKPVFGHRRVPVIQP